MKQIYIDCHCIVIKQMHIDCHCIYLSVCFYLYVSICMYLSVSNKCIYAKDLGHKALYLREENQSNFGACNHTANTTCLYIRLAKHLCTFSGLYMNRLTPWLHQWARRSEQSTPTKPLAVCSITAHSTPTPRYLYSLGVSVTENFSSETKDFHENKSQMYIVLLWEKLNKILLFLCIYLFLFGPFADRFLLLTFWI